MKATLPAVLSVFLAAATPALAAVSPAHSPTLQTKVLPVEGTDKLIVQSQRTEELPPECRGYYVRPHKANGLSRCE